MSDVSTAKRMLNLAILYGLSGSGWVRTFSLETLARDFNGIGPEWFPSRLREAIDKLHADLLPMAFIHDVRWSHSNGEYSYFKSSNEELKRNGYLIAKVKYPWYRPERYIRMNQARVFGNLCQVFGWSAYQEAYKKGKRK